MPTRKHVRYGCAIAQRLRELGHQVTLTTREHPDTVNIMENLGEQFKLIGKYDPTSLATRFRASIERELQFYEMFKDNKPQIAISHGSVELGRTAFGLGIHNICTGDTTYTKANWLIVPLTDILLISKAIPKEAYEKYCAKRIIQFDGVDEVAWVQSYERKRISEYKHPLIVVRQSEFKASYMKGKDVTLDIAKKLSKLGNVIFLSRYDKRKIQGLTIPEKFVDSLKVSAEADLVVGVGGTVAREAALQGTPSLVVPMLGWSYVNEYVFRKGFPLYKVKLGEVMKFAKINIGRRIDVKKSLAGLENPVDIITNLVQKRVRRDDKDS